MKRLSLFGFVGALAGVLAGCPIYDDNTATPPVDTCTDPSCENPGPLPGCKSPNACGINETCGSDGKCHIGDCTLWGCIKGFECTLNDDATVSCKEPTASTTGGQGGSGGTSSAGGAGGMIPPPTVYCGNPGDCASNETCSPDGICTLGDCSTIGCIHGYACGNDKLCKSTNPAACSQDGECSGFGSGFLCVNGICTAPSDQCSDGTQCPPANKCADGKCTTACSSNVECPSGYLCNMNTGVCSVPQKPCVITNDCGGSDAVCVDGACVPRSSKTGVCAKGVWVDNGCISSQSATFFCAADGQQDSCAMGSLCLHHNCYIACEAPNGSACDNLPTFNVCKDVTTISGPHKVCGSNQNLGSDCDPTLGNNCSAGKACIDGFCK